MEAKDANWKSVAVLALMNVYDPEMKSTRFDDLLFVQDTASQCIKCVANISCLWRYPRETFYIYKLNLVFDHEQIKAVTSCSTHKIDQQETDG